MVDAKMLHQLEDWSVAPSGRTTYLPAIEKFLEQIAGRAKKIASLHREKEPLGSGYKRKLKDSYVDTCCLVFDGMLQVAMAPDEPDLGRRQSRVAVVRRANKDIVSWPCFLSEGQLLLRRKNGASPNWNDGPVAEDEPAAVTFRALTSRRRASS